VLRLVELFLPEESKAPIETVLEEQPTLARWNSPVEGDRVRITVLLGGDATEDTIQALEDRVLDITDARIILLSVEATVPRPEEIAEEAEAESEAPVTVGDEPEPEEPEVTFGSARLSTPELYQDVLDLSELTTSYVGLVVLSAIVAAFGLFTDNVIAIIGAMVIAPLIGPNVGLALATTLADDRLAAKSIVTNLVGLGAALGSAVLMGLWLDVDPFEPTLAGMTVINVENIGLALAAGGAAVLSLTVGVSTALVGVMVAVALLPPTVAAGMFVGSGFHQLAWRAGLLVISNVICINLAGVLAFVVQGVRPNRYWEAEQARYSTAVAVTLWAILLGVLVYIVWFGVGVDVTSPASP
jgi:uncharacterized hydrophobic protein (TIGR00341 family)